MRKTQVIVGASWLACVPAWSASFDCLIEPTQAIDVGSPVAGLLDKVYVRRGDRVAAGQVLATLESQAEQAAAELARYKSQASGPTMTAESKIEFSKRKFQRRLRTIRSPFDGVVADQLLYPGEVVEPTGNKKTILKLAQLDPLRVHVILPMAAFRKVSLGMTAQVYPEMPIGGSYSAKVKIVDKLIDAASGTFAAFLEMRNPRLSIPVGVKCKAEFPITLEARPAQ